MDEKPKSIGRTSSQLMAELEMMDTKELARLMKFDEKTIYEWARKGLIPHVRIQSGVRFLKAQILEWIGQHNFRPRSAQGDGSKKG